MIENLVPPTITGDLVEDIEKIEGESLTMRCEFGEGTNPKPKIQWTKKDSRTFPEHAEILSDNATVYISSVSKSDEGSWTCYLQYFMKIWRRQGV